MTPFLAKFCLCLMGFALVAWSCWPHRKPRDGQRIADAENRWQDAMGRESRN